MGLKLGERLRGIEKLVDIRGAYARLLSKVTLLPKEIEKVAVSNALERILGTNLRATTNIPPFDRAAMDGYVVKAKDTIGASTTNPIFLKLRGNIDAGEDKGTKIEKGQTIQVNTGAKIPEGGNAVVRVEDAEKTGDYVKVYKSVPSGKDISKKGEDIEKGEIIAKKGRRLSSYDLSLLTSLQRFNVPVRKQPRVGLLACGDELIEPTDLMETDQEIPEGKVVESNSIMLRKLTQRAGAVPVPLGVVSDSKTEIKRRIVQGVQQHDLLLTIGGTSVGSKDLLPQAIAEIKKAQILVHGIKAMPGKPLLLSTVNSSPVISLPGYPVSAAIDFLLFAKPLIKHQFLDVRSCPPPCKIPALLKKKIPSKVGLTHFVRVDLERKNNKNYAKPIRTSGAGILTTLTRADGFLIIPKDVEGFEKGEEVGIVRINDLSQKALQSFA